MSRTRFHRGEMPEPSWSDDLAQAPDLTESIMHRLGYMRVSRAHARRETRMWWIRRAMLMVALLFIGAFAVHRVQVSEQVLMAEQPSISGAVVHEFRDGAFRLDDFIRTFRVVMPGERTGDMEGVTPAGAGDEARPQLIQRDVPGDGGDSEQSVVPWSGLL